MEKLEFEVVDYYVDIYEHSYEEGELDKLADYNGNDIKTIGLKANTLSELVDLIQEEDFTFNNAYVGFVPDVYIYMQNTVNKELQPVLDSEIEEWKKGNIKLYSAEATIKIDKISQRNPITEEDAKEAGIDTV